MRGIYLFILFISSTVVTYAQTLSPAKVGSSAGVYKAPPGKSLSYGVNNISLVSVAPVADSSAVQIINALGDNEKSDWLQLYPNPVTDNLWMGLQLNGTGTATICMLDNAGRKVAEFKMETSATERITRQMDVSKLPAGIYLLNVVFTPSNGAAIQTLAKKFQVLR